MPTNRDLNIAKKAKKDEFYTSFTDIEKEMCYYKKYFYNKVVFCNCNDAESDFWNYFSQNFESLSLKRLIATQYNSVGLSYMKEKWKDESGIHEVKRNLLGNGDFYSLECIALLKQADIVVTNPPFSLWRSFVSLMIEYKKKFLILGNVNAITYKELFPSIMTNQVWLGASIHSGDREFKVPNDYPLNAAGCRIDDDRNKYIRVKGVRWFTNMDYSERYKNLYLTAQYEQSKYKRYDNYDAINIDSVKDIPYNYNGVMGVPITFLDKYNPNQFQIVGKADSGVSKSTNQYCLVEEGNSVPTINGKSIYKRLLIKRI